MVAKQEALHYLKQMMQIRQFEDMIMELLGKNIAEGGSHLYAGEEASGVGVCMHLDDRDAIASTHRGHGHCIAKGCDVTGMMLEIYGRSDGLCKGKGGSMHIADVTKGMLGANAIVGGGPPLAVGAAIACRNRGDRRVSIAFGGDGSCNQGTVFEAMNMAVVLKVPAIFVIEDNGYSEHTGKDYAVGSKDIAGRARGFGMPAEKCDGADFFAVYEAAGRLIDCARRGEGPSTLEATITRFYGHFEGDPQLYRAKDEVKRQRESMDCLKNFRARVTAEGWLTAAALDAVDAEVLAVIDAAVAAAKAAAPPAESELEADVYITY